MLRKEGYSPYQTALAVAAGQTASVNAVLLAAAAAEPEPAPAELEKTSSAGLAQPRRPLWRLLTGVLLIGGGATVLRRHAQAEATARIARTVTLDNHWASLRDA